MFPRLRDQIWQISQTLALSSHFRNISPPWKLYERSSWSPSFLLFQYNDTLGQVNSQRDIGTNLQITLNVNCLHSYGRKDSWHYIIDPSHPDKESRSCRYCQRDCLWSMELSKSSFIGSPNPSTPCCSFSFWVLYLVHTQNHAPIITALKPAPGK